MDSSPNCSFPPTFNSAATADLVGDANENDSTPAAADPIVWRNALRRDCNAGTASISSFSGEVMCNFIPKLESRLVLEHWLVVKALVPTRLKTSKTDLELIIIVIDEYFELKRVIRYFPLFR